MKYLLKQKMISIGDDFNITKETGELVYIADGYGMSIGKRFSFQDANKNEIFDVKQKLFSFSPTFRIYQNKILLATVKRSLGAFRDVFYITFDHSKKKIKVVGKLLEHEYRFTHEGREIAEVSKKWFRGTDTYAVNITSKKFEHPVLLSAAVIIDLICHDKKSKHDRG